MGTVKMSHILQAENITVFFWWPEVVARGCDINTNDIELL